MKTAKHDASSSLRLAPPHTDQDPMVICRMGCRRQLEVVDMQQCHAALRRVVYPDLLETGDERFGRHRDGTARDDHLNVRYLRPGRTAHVIGGISPPSTVLRHKRGRKAWPMKLGRSFPLLALAATTYLCQL